MQHYRLQRSSSGMNLCQRIFPGTEPMWPDRSRKWQGFRGRYVGVAPESSLLVVKLGVAKTDGFPRTTGAYGSGGLCSLQGQNSIRCPWRSIWSFGNIMADMMEGHCWKLT